MTPSSAAPEATSSMTPWVVRSQKRVGEGVAAGRQDGVGEGLHVEQVVLPGNGEVVRGHVGSLLRWDLFKWNDTRWPDENAPPGHRFARSLPYFALPRSSMKRLALCSEDVPSLPAS